MDSLDKNQPEYEEKINFDLSITRTTHWGNDHTKLFYAMEYLRFLEQSGHPLRLGNVTNTRGLEGTLTRLVLYYPNWCLMQTIMAQDTKHLDLFYGRAQLSCMTQTEVDKIVDEYVGILNELIENINLSFLFSAISIYDYAAIVLPQVMGRLLYKCSVSKLDSVLELTLKICCSDAIHKFKGVNQLIKGVLRSYTESEQLNRLDKILSFPIERNRVLSYEDPIQQISVSKKRKIKLSEK